MTIVLRGERFHEDRDLSLDLCFRQGNEHVWMPKIPFVLGYLIFQYQMRPEGIPGEVCKQRVVLVPILEPVRQDQVWSGILQLLENVLDFALLTREVTRPKIEEP